MCKIFCRIVITIYLLFILGLVITAIYYVTKKDEIKYTTIPLSFIGITLFTFIISCILKIFKNCCYFPKIFPSPQPKREIIELKEAIIDENNFITIVIENPDQSLSYATNN